MKQQRKLRVCMGLVEVCGYFARLTKGFEALGIDSTYLCLHKFDDYRRYEGGDRNNYVRLFLFARDKRFATPARNVPMKLWWIAVHRCAEVALTAWAIANHDVFLFSFSTTFLEFRELPLLKALNKKIIYVFFGSDGRPAYIGKGAQESWSWESVVEDTHDKKERIRKIERHADVVVTSPLIAHLHERPVVIYTHVGMPIEVSVDVGSESRSSNGDDQGVRVVHAPSLPGSKGTSVIREAIANLQEKGLAIDYVEMIGRTNEDVLRELATCDFVVDQLNGDGPISTFGVEAAYFGKPSINGSHTSDAWEAFEEEDFPIVHHCGNAVEDVERAIEKLATDAGYRERLGRHAQRYVRERWSPANVARQIVRLVEGDIPSRWFFDPNELLYVHGWGPESKSRPLVREIIEKAGSAALQVSDKPNLERRFIEFAGLDPDKLAES